MGFSQKVIGRTGFYFGSATIFYFTALTGSSAIAQPLSDIEIIEIAQPLSDIEIIEIETNRLILGQINPTGTVPETIAVREFIFEGNSAFTDRATEALFVVRSDVQFATTDLVPLEQFGLGGLRSVRGYRQDALLAETDEETGFLREMSVSPRKST